MSYQGFYSRCHQISRSTPKHWAKWRGSKYPCNRTEPVPTRGYFSWIMKNYPKSIKETTRSLPKCTEPSVVFPCVTMHPIIAKPTQAHAKQHHYTRIASHFHSLAWMFIKLIALLLLCIARRCTVLHSGIHASWCAMGTLLWVAVCWRGAIVYRLDCRHLSVGYRLPIILPASWVVSLSHFHMFRVPIIGGRFFLIPKWSHLRGEKVGQVCSKCS